MVLFLPLLTFADLFSTVIVLAHLIMILSNRNHQLGFKLTRFCEALFFIAKNSSCSQIFMFLI